MAVIGDGSSCEDWDADMRTTYAGMAVVVAALTVVVAAGWLTPFAPPGPPSTGGIAPAGDPVPAGAVRADAAVLVDTSSPDHGDFARLIAPYLDHLGVPYTLFDVAQGTPDADLGAFSVIVLGHRGLARQRDALALQAWIEPAVTKGTGVVNFDSDLWVDGASRYPFVQRALAFDRAPAVDTRGVTFAPLLDITAIDLADDGHQQPRLPTTSDLGALDGSDGKWTEYLLPARGFPALMAGVDEFERHGLPPMRFKVNGVRPGRYEVVASVYTGAPGQDIRYYYGFAGEGPRARHIDATGGSGGTEEHTEYWLGPADVDQGGVFELVVQDADLLRGTYPVFGWARLRLVRVLPGAPAPHYVAAGHPRHERVPTAAMTLAGLRLRDPGAAVAFSGDQPLLITGTLGSGRVVQWATYDWMRTEVRGPLGGLDDLVWRSVVWAARKPFVMQVLPPIVTMRMDDASGPLEWLRTAMEVGFKPWVGVFLSNIDDREARELADLARGGDATVSVHSFDDPTFFYFDHVGRREWPASTMAANWQRAVEWHSRYGIPMSRYVVPHFYEIGVSALPLLRASGVEFLATHMAPGGAYGMPWLRSGPFRRDVRGTSTDPVAVYYADFLPGTPQSDAGQLFNCVTEIRDDAGYEWYPIPDVDATARRGTRQLRRALDSRALATLFTHGYFIPPLAADWRTILDRIREDIAPYGPIQMTMDDACRFVRDQRTSAVASVIFDPPTGMLRAMLTGRTTAPTTLSIFTDVNGSVAERTIAVPPFEGTTTVGAPASAQSGGAAAGRR
jgi:hypothetical protein